MAEYDAVVVGSGPNGLAAAVEIARSGRSVLVLEAAPTIGGGTRTAETTLPGHRHDTCSAIHPLAVGSPYLASLPLEDHGLTWIHPELPVAHPLEGLPAAVLERSLESTASGLEEDGAAYRKLLGPIVQSWPATAPIFMSPAPQAWRSPVAAGRFGLHALRSVTALAGRFETRRARGLLAGMGAHSMAALDTAVTAGVALVLTAAAHRCGWPMARGGSQAIADALGSLLRSAGGTIVTGTRVSSLRDLPRTRAILFDTSPANMVSIAGELMPGRYRAALERRRPGPGVFKIDWALSGPIPWTDPSCARAGTVHVGGRFREIASSEAAVLAGDHPERPFVLLAQQSLFDETRAPPGRHTAWGYCHVPNGSTVDMTGRIEAQIERFAPGFRDVVAARHVMATPDLEAHNLNNVGGDIGAGLFTPLRALARPTARLDPYRVPRSDLYLCSAATPPGPGVHGMCGYHAARSALRHSLR